MALDKTTLYAAAITGAFALTGTLISSYFSYRANQAPQDPVAPASMVQVEPLSNTPTVAPNFRLNFAAFQRVTKDQRAPEQLKSQAVAQCQAAQVVWRGFVDEVSAHSSQYAEGASAMTVTLCEDPSVCEQTMFKQPAICRFGAESLSELQSLTPGAEVTITGTFEQHSAVGAILTGCRVLETVRR